MLGWFKRSKPTLEQLLQQLDPGIGCAGTIAEKFGTIAKSMIALILSSSGLRT